VVHLVLRYRILMLHKAISRWKLAAILSVEHEQVNCDFQNMHTEYMKLEITSAVERLFTFVSRYRIDALRMNLGAWRRAVFSLNQQENVCCYGPVVFPHFFSACDRAQFEG